MSTKKTPTAADAAATPTDAAATDAATSQGNDQATETAEALVKARVLSQCVHGNPNDVVSVPESVAQLGQAAGELDTDPAAVAYAELLNAQTA